MIKLAIRTNAKSELVDITHQVQQAVAQAGITDGLCTLFVPHTTAGLTLNENWDPDVRRDVLLTMADISPTDPRHRHGEGNSPAHIKSSLIGASALVIIEDSRLQLGSWQGIYLTEFDGPRTRKIWLKIISG